MKSFLQFLAESDNKNTHMTHIEDLVIYGGVNGIRKAILTLRNLRNMLAGHSNTEVDITRKWDGSPAIFAGTDRSDGKFFVATKGIFAEKPTLYKTQADVTNNKKLDEDLADKLSTALSELSKLGIKNVIQGDIMFTQKTIDSETIDGEKYLTFHPNTIVYAIPLSDKSMVNKIKAAKIGVVWHTSYNGGGEGDDFDFKKMTTSYGVDISKLNNTSSVWMISADSGLHDLSGKATLTKSETLELNTVLKDAGTLFNKIKSSVISKIENNQTFAQTLEQFNNTLVRSSKKITNPKKHVEDLISWADEKHNKAIDKLKSDRGKERAAQRKDEYMSFFSNENKKSLANMYELQNALVKAKEIIIKKLDSIKHLDTFVKTKNGFKVTGHEGFVAIDNLEGGALKLVDRMEFSTNNFNPDIIKGWER